MKIIRLTTFLNFGGIERRCQNISYIRDEHEWIFCAINKGGEAEKQIRRNNKTVYALGLPYRIPSLRTIYRLMQFFKQQKPDVVHTSGAEANFHGVIAARLAGIPTIVAEEIGIPTQHFYTKQIFRIIYALSHYVIGNSDPVVDYLANKNKVASHKLIKIPNPVIPPNEIPETPVKSKVFTMVSISRLDPVKNIESVLRTVRRLIDNNIRVKYIIVGDGISNNALKEQAKTLQIENEVDFTGYQPNPFLFLQNADLYVLNSFSEGFSNSLLESMVSGTPSLSTRVGAAEEIITDGETGWLISPGSDDELYAKIHRIINLSPEEREKIGQNGKYLIATRFSIENYTSQLVSIYTKKSVNH